MADNQSVYQGSAGSAFTVATDDVGAVHYQRVKLVDGTLDSTAAIPGDATNGLDVDVTRVSGNVTVIQGTATNLKVDASGVAVPITDNSGSLTVDQPTGTNLHTVLDSGTLTTITNVVHVDDNSSSLTIDQATASSLNAQVVGNVASDASDSGNPVKVGAVAITALPAAATSGNRVNVRADEYGRLFVRSGHQVPGGNVTVKSNAPAVNTAASAVAASASGVRYVCTAIAATVAAGSANPGAAVPATLNLRDGGSGAGSVLWSTYLGVPTTTGGTTGIAISDLWIPGTAATAMTLEFSAASGANTYQSVNFTCIQLAE